MKNYVLGFMFTPDKTKVALIEKARPEWQAGLLNGIGGKIEPGEEPHEAMRREFFEEAGVDFADWEKFMEIGGRDWRCHVYRAFDPMVRSVCSVTDEPVTLFHVGSHLPLPSNVIPNLRWIIPLALDEFPQGVQRISYASTHGTELKRVA